MHINIQLKSINKCVPFSTNRSAPPIGYNARRCGARRLARPHHSLNEFCTSEFTELMLDSTHCACVLNTYDN